MVSGGIGAVRCEAVAWNFWSQVTYLDIASDKGIFFSLGTKVDWKLPGVVRRGVKQTVKITHLQDVCCDLRS